MSITPMTPRITTPASIRSGDDTPLSDSSRRKTPICDGVIAKLKDRVLTPGLSEEEKDLLQKTIARFERRRYIVANTPRIPRSQSVPAGLSKARAAGSARSPVILGDLKRLQLIIELEERRARDEKDRMDAQASRFFKPIARKPAELDKI